MRGGCWGLLCCVSFVLSSCGGSGGDVPEAAKVLRPGVGLYELVLPVKDELVRLGDPVDGRVWLRALKEIQGGAADPESKKTLDQRPKAEGLRFRWTGKMRVVKAGRGGPPLLSRPFRAWFLRTGERVLPAIGDKVKVAERKVRVKGILPKGAKAAPVLPDSLIRDPEPSFPWLWAGVFAAILALGAAWYLWKRRKKDGAGLPKPIPIPPGRRALIQLKELAQSLEEGSVSGEELVDQVTRVLRRYLDEALGLRTREQTTEEILRELARHPELAEMDRARLSSIVRQADLVKFAGQGADLRLSRELLEGARAFVLALEEKIRKKEKEAACA